MFGHKHYVPVLKGKRAEFPALQELRSNESITPLFEAVPTSEPEYVPKRMSAFWPSDKPYFIDLLFLDDEEMDESEASSHPLLACFKEVVEKNQAAIPVTGTGRSPAYQSATKEIVREHGRGCAIRILLDDFEDEDELVESINALLELFEIQKGDIDLIVDADTVAEMRTGTVAQLQRANLLLLPNINDWRTLTVVAGAFPLGIGPLTRDIWNTNPRTDWLGWNQVVSRPRGLSRIPTYGDYTIAHPNLPPTGRATILGQLRYTTRTDFLIWKGHNVYTHPSGFRQFNERCKDLIQRPEYCDQNFSWADSEIYAKATTDDSPGNAETWRRIGVNHHIETVMDQIANLP